MTAKRWDVRIKICPTRNVQSKSRDWQVQKQQLREHKPFRVQCIYIYLNMISWTLTFHKMWMKI